MRPPLHALAVVRGSVALSVLWFVGLIGTWIAIAGEAGSPRPDNWDTMERVLAIVEYSLLFCIALLLPLAPLAWSGARDGKRWAGVYPVLFAVACTVQIALCLYQLARPIPPHIA